MEVHFRVQTSDNRRETARIVDLKSMFASLRTLRRALDAVDSGCHYTCKATGGHYTCKATGVDLAGHLLMCTIAGCENHILLWIDGAPVAGKDDDDVVLQWIQERITCRIPDKTTNPGLH